MPFIDWHEDFTVGIASLDAEHKHFLSLLNELYDSIQLDRTQESLPEVIDHLIHCIVVHIQHEEQYMLVTNFPDYEHHRAEHEGLRQQMLRLRAEAERGATMCLANEILAFLKGWVMGHVLFSDKAYAAHFHACGIRD